MARRGVSGVSVVAALIVGLVVGLGAMYVLAPSILGTSTSTIANSSVSTATVSSTTTVTSTAAGTGATTVTQTTTLTGPITTLPAITSTETQTATQTATVTSTTTAAQGFTGVVYVSIPSGTGSNPNQSFSPSTITVVIGVNNTVIWTNNDVVQHTVTADKVSMFNSQALNPGQAFGYTFTQPGTYGYTCQFHGWMTGKVIVKAGSG